MMTYREMYELAEKNLAPKAHGDGFSSGSVSAVLEGANGKYYCGVNIDLYCGLGFCAERSAAVQAVGNGDREFIKIAVAVSGSRVKSPCGICRQFLAEFSRNLTVVYEKTARLRRRSCPSCCRIPLRFEKRRCGVGRKMVSLRHD